APTVPGTISTQAQIPDSEHQSAWYFRSLLDKSFATDDKLVVHSGSDAVLGEKLFAEMRQRDIDVVRLEEKVCFWGPHFNVAWSIIRQDTFVTVKAEVIANG